jgi:hypothetical protein
VNKYRIVKVGPGKHAIQCPSGVCMCAGEYGTETSPIDGLSDWQRVNAMVDELGRLNSIKTAARSQGLLTKDGTLPAVADRVWVPAMGCTGEVVIRFGRQVVAFNENSGMLSKYFAMDECYSTPEAAQAAAKAGGGA